MKGNTLQRNRKPHGEIHLLLHGVIWGWRFR